MNKLIKNISFKVKLRGHKGHNLEVGEGLDRPRTPLIVKEN